jgi:hypothetical protein
MKWCTAVKPASDYKLFDFLKPRDKLESQHDLHNDTVTADRRSGLIHRQAQSASRRPRKTNIAMCRGRVDMSQVAKHDQDPDALPELKAELHMFLETTPPRTNTR